MLGVPIKVHHPSEVQRRYVTQRHGIESRYELDKSRAHPGYPCPYKSNGTYYAKKAANASASAAERAGPALEALKKARTFPVSPEVQAARAAQRQILNAARGFETS